MIMRDGNQNPVVGGNPFSKVTTLRGFNNTPENIRNQMNSFKMPMPSKPEAVKPAKNPQEPKATYDPSRQKENMIQVSRISNDSR